MFHEINLCIKIQAAIKYKVHKTTMNTRLQDKPKSQMSPKNNSDTGVLRKERNQETAKH